MALFKYIIVAEELSNILHIDGLPAAAMFTLAQAPRGHVPKFVIARNGLLIKLAIIVFVIQVDFILF